MSRRGFLLAASASLLVTPRGASAQPRGRSYRVGILGNIPSSDSQGARVWGEFTEGLRRLGYVEGQNLLIEHRSSEGQIERLPGLAAELVRMKPDVIVAANQAGGLAAHAATRTIPIINLRTAKALGLTIPASVLARADHVIE